MAKPIFIGPNQTAGRSNHMAMNYSFPVKPGPDEPRVRFSAVLPALAKAARAQRDTWAPNQYIWLLPEATVPKEWCKEPHLLHIASTNPDGKVVCRASIRMRMPDQSVLTGWVPTAEDMYASDWTITELGAATGGTAVDKEAK